MMHCQQNVKFLASTASVTMEIITSLVLLMYSYCLFHSKSAHLSSNTILFNQKNYELLLETTTVEVSSGGNAS